MATVFLLVVVFIAALQCSHLKPCDVQLGAQRRRGTGLPRRRRRSQNSSDAVLIRCVLLQKVTLYFGTNQQNKSLSQELFKWFLATAPACAINLTDLGHHHWLKLPKNVATNSEEPMWLHSCVPCRTNFTGGFSYLIADGVKNYNSLIIFLFLAKTKLGLHFLRKADKAWLLLLFSVLPVNTNWACGVLQCIRELLLWQQERVPCKRACVLRASGIRGGKFSREREGEAKRATRPLVPI